MERRIRCESALCTVNDSWDRGHPIHSPPFFGAEMNKVILKSSSDITDFLSEKRDMFSTNTRLFNNPRLMLEQEIHYACDILNNSRTAKREGQRLLWNIAINCPGKLREAFMRVSQIGLSLNPSLGHLNMIPRGGKICLDIGYKGWIKIGVDNCHLINVEAHVIRQGDEYQNNGFDKPFHFISDELNPNRNTQTAKDIIGAFAQCMFDYNGENHYRVCVMNYTELEKCRLANPVNKYDENATKGAWGNWKDRMYRKYPITRLAKNWLWEDSQKQSVIADIAADEFVKENTEQKVLSLLRSKEAEKETLKKEEFNEVTPYREDEGAMEATN